MNDLIHIVIINHKYGSDIYATPDADEADRYLMSYCLDWTDDSMSDNEMITFYQEVIAGNFANAIKQYFTHDKCGEYYDTAVVASPADWLGDADTLKARAEKELALLHEGMTTNRIVRDDSSNPKP